MENNTQDIEKRTRAFDGTYDVHSIFYTIQGEGPFCGTPAVFIRLAGCNLQCPLCDTDYTEGRKRRKTEDILKTVIELMPKQEGLVVITGGEPFRQRLEDLMIVLTMHNFYVQIETNGTLPVPPHMPYNKDIGQREGVYVVCSPKAGRVNPSVWQHACCAKYVMDALNVNQLDGLPFTALGHTANPQLARPPMGFKRPIYLQPCDHQDEQTNQRNLDACVDSCMKHGYTLQLQIHKLLGME